jgi:protein SCO1
MPSLARTWPALLLPALLADTSWSATVLDEAEALRIGQAAIGRQLEDHVLRDSSVRRVALSDFRGKTPSDQFRVHQLLLGLPDHRPDPGCGRRSGAAGAWEGQLRSRDHRVRYPPRHARAHARVRAHAQSIDRPGWRFLSGDAATVDALAEQVGFVVYPAPQGFDHMALTTVVDQEGRIYRQIYGGVFEAPAVVEPLKDLVFGRRSDWTSLEGLVNRVRLFCTMYDPRTGAYRFDYTPFITLAIGLAALAGVGGFALREWRRAGPWRPRT